MKEINEIQKIFAERLTAFMVEKSLTQYTLAEKIKIPRTTVAGWLNLKRTPRADALWAIADYFDVTVDYLIGREKF